MNATEMVFVIFCMTSGGVTGTRTAYLKGDDGRVARFNTREEAQAVCPKSRTLTTGASLQYYPYEIEAYKID